MASELLPQISQESCISQLISLPQFIFGAEKAISPPLALKPVIFLVTGRMCCSLCDILEKAKVCSDECVRGFQGLTGKRKVQLKRGEHREFFWGNGIILHPDRDGSYMSLYICTI